MEPFVSEIAGRIRDKKLREEIAAELEDHVQSKAALYEQRGFDPETAAEKANADMGPQAEQIAEDLGRIHGAEKVLDICLYIVCLMCIAANLIAAAFAFEGEAWSRDLRLIGWYDAIYLSLFAVLIISYRRRFALPALLTNIAFLSAYNRTLHFTVFFAALVTGRGAVFTADAVRDTLYVSSDFAFYVNFAALNLLFLLSPVLAHCIAVRRHRVSTAREKRVGKAVFCVFMTAAAFCCVCCAAQGMILLSEPVRNVRNTYPKSDSVLIVADDDDRAFSEAELQKYLSGGVDESGPAYVGCLFGSQDSRGGGVEIVTNLPQRKVRTDSQLFEAAGGLYGGAHRLLNAEPGMHRFYRVYYYRRGKLFLAERLPTADGWLELHVRRLSGVDIRIGPFSGDPAA